jgi:hypothetical protein
MAVREAQNKNSAVNENKISHFFQGAIPLSYRTVMPHRISLSVTEIFLMGK